MSQIDSLKEEIKAMQEHYEREIKLLNERIDALCIEFHKVKK